METTEFLTEAKALDLFRRLGFPITRTTIFKYRKDGKIPFRKPYSRVLYRSEDIVAFLNLNKQEEQ